MKKILIPITFGQPSVTVSINDKEHILETGKEIEVEDCVADLFEDIASRKPYMEPSPAPWEGGYDGTGGGNSGGDSGGDSGGSGTHKFSGIYMAEERAMQNIEFSTPGGVSNFVMFMLDEPDLETESGFCLSYVAIKDNHVIGAGSNNTGTAVNAGGLFSADEISTGYFYRFVFGEDKVTMIPPASTAKYIRAPQVGKRYYWMAW